VDSELTLGDDLEDLLNPDLPSIIDLQGTPRQKSAIRDCEYDSLEQGLVTGVKGTVDENVLGVCGGHEILVLDRALPFGGDFALRPPPFVSALDGSLHGS
jgi:hypothetical protein